jgi:Flp pilus assembly protein TadD
MAIGKLAVAITCGIALSGCASQEIELRNNAELRQAIDNAVPPSWREAADTYIYPDPVAVSDELREFIQESVRNQWTQRDKLVAIAEAIIESEGIGLTYDAQATYSASEAFRYGTGNCLGFANLLVAAAREVGIPAKYQLVTDTQMWHRNGNLLVSSQHVRVIGFANGRRMVLDFYPQPLETLSRYVTLSDNEALAHYLNAMAVTAMEAEDNADAYAKLRSAIAAASHVDFLWSNMGALLLRAGEENLAEAAFKESVFISSDSLSAMSSLQRLYMKQGRDEEAAELAEEVEKYRNRNPYYHFARAEAAFVDEDWDEAVDRYRAAIRLKKNEKEFYAGLANAYSQLGETGAARRAKRKADAIGADKVKRMTLSRGTGRAADQ